MLQQLICKNNYLKISNRKKIWKDLKRVVKKNHPVFSSLQLNKANGPDRISTRILKVCAAQLAIPYTIIFNQSLSLHKSPTIWKTSEIVPVPKKPKVKELNDLRPVALTSILVKCLER